MDDKGATLVCDSPAPAELETAEGPGCYLIVLSGGVPGAMLKLGPGVNWLGRAADNSVQLLEATVSRRHAALRIEPDGAAWLTDLGSSNGTYRNGRRLLPQRPVELEDGDKLQFGRGVVVKFARPDACEERFQRELFDRAMRDGLTGLYNRRFFLDGIGPLAQRASARALGVAVL